MIAPLLGRLAAREDLTREEASRLVALLLDEATTDAQAGAALVALAMKGETAEELAGLAAAMRERATGVRTRHRVFVDTAGTGGDGSGTFNVSTSAAFVIAAAGVPVAKHGNRAASSRSGSADVLGALGAPVEMDAEAAGRCLDEIGLCFLFAPLYHPATRRVAEVRRQLGVRTAFNLLGPLTNPAGAPRQVIGVGVAAALERVAEAAAMLGAERAWIVHGDGLDEITVTGVTRVAEVRDGRFESVFEVDPAELGLPRRSRDELLGGEPARNAEIVRGVLAGRTGGAARDIVLLNAAAGLVVGGAADSLASGLDAASRAVDSGAAADLLARFCGYAQSSSS
jgi:anthranilate phosphoribosyltransferase